jgi:hypothetical protein
MLDPAGDWVCADENDAVTDLSGQENGIADSKGRVTGLKATQQKRRTRRDLLRNPDPPCFDNSNRYVDCQNGTVTDTVTGLIWLRDGNCFNGPTDWKSASEFAARLAHGQCGLTDNSKAGDWRLPTREEWSKTTAGAVSRGCYLPTLTDMAGTACFANNPPFTGVWASYWSSSTPDTQPDAAGIASLIFGITGFEGKEAFNWVWPVRDGH